MRSSWKATTILGENDEEITRQFNEQVEVVYAELLKKLDKSRANLQEISQQYQQTASQDFFHSKLGNVLREKLLSKRGDKS